MKIFHPKQRLKDWIVRLSKHPHAEWWLGVIAFAEASFLPIPPDLLLIPMITVVREKWLRYATITTLTSVLGGVLGYVIGFWFFGLVGERVIEIYNLQEQFARVSEMFANNAFLAVFLSAFTPIPYKIFTISAGFFKASIWVFVVASLVGRMLRFYIESFLVHHFGRPIARQLYNHFNWITLFVVLVIGFVVYFAR